eukprot:TRINITY_DN9280_c1_g1_i3.p3 TRINITY_DN9280_c1_g1~~TRINITY_DN9280_c1_g1_i3.p3  ORF type:complete len:159 (+),score=46.06 TRINITY_DN9280_c1_g1_i3:685-1161(+)
MEPSVLWVRVTRDPQETAGFLGTLTAYVARAPYKHHAHTPKVFSERAPGELYRRMLQTVPGLGPRAADAVARQYPTLRALLRAVGAADAEERVAQVSVPVVAELGHDDGRWGAPQPPGDRASRDAAEDPGKNLLLGRAQAAALISALTVSTTPGAAGP